MAQHQRADWGDDWGGGGRRDGRKPSDNIILNDQAEFDAYPDDHRYGRNNYADNSQFQPPAYGETHHRLPPQGSSAAPNMDYRREEYASPWYRKKRTWAAVALVIILVIVVPVAVVVSRNKNRANAYPDYSTLNYTLLETCESSPP
jgi:hypothetical protein